ncbi:MAG TPA: DUF4249 family protein [Candidatus Latescibacteria bacterium]|nr:DUF4249 family protein [Candidatus Latescibacterota bacterium]MDP7633132.1 DUF4249 family protein [Candidatus Latescibacterota bacterium]MEE3041209.1 DUF4249 family protein [Candidatus Latescibacterota bacterium]HJN28145.1 DUF4249 family protein [Candidatus Latescibacterota bacterium]
MRSLLILLVLSGIWVGCGADREPGDLFGSIEEDVLVLDGTLIVDQPLPFIYVRRTADPGQVYDEASYGVTDARVELTAGDTQWSYEADPASPGRYRPPTPTPMVEPSKAYRLEVRIDGEVAGGVTTTPGRMNLRRTVLLDEKTLEVVDVLVPFSAGADSSFASPTNRLIYREGVLEMQLAEPVAGAIAYQLSLTGLDRDSDFVIDADFLEEEDYEEFDREGASPPLEVDEGLARVPWFAVAFEGRHILRLFAIDENWFDFIRTNLSDDDGGGFGGLAGDAFERPIFRLDGAIGLFGSAAADSVGIVVLPRPDGD